MEKTAKIYVAGHRGMVGSAIVRELKRQGYENILTRTHAELEKNPNAFSLQRRRSAELVQIARRPPILCTKT